MKDEPLGKRCRICQRYSNGENLSDIAPRLWIWSLPGHKFPEERISGSIT